MPAQVLRNPTYEIYGYACKTIAQTTKPGTVARLVYLHLA